MGGGGTSLYIHMYVCQSVPYENGFLSLSFEKLTVLDSYFVHRYIIITYRSVSVLGKIQQLFREPFFNFHIIFA